MVSRRLTLILGSRNPACLSVRQEGYRVDLSCRGGVYSNRAVYLDQSLIAEILRFTEEEATDQHPLRVGDFLRWSDRSPSEVHRIYYHIGLCSQGGWIEVRKIGGKSPRILDLAADSKRAREVRQSGNF